MNNYKIVKFFDGDFELDVNVSTLDKSVWLSQKDMSLLFEKSQSTIAKHLFKISSQFIHKNGAVYSQNEYTGSDGKSYKVNYYKLEIVIEVGHRCHSQRIDSFISWANTLKESNISNNNNSESINNIDNRYEIVKFRDGEFELDVNVSPSEDTVWLTIEQMSYLFERDCSVIRKHLKKILDENKDITETIWAKNAYMLRNGRKYNYVLYSLNTLIQVGFKVESHRAIVFRVWAMKTINDFICKGYALNHQRLLNNNGCLSLFADNLKSLSEQISKNTNNIEKLNKVVFPKQVLFQKDTPYSSKSYCVNLLRKAKDSIIIIDPYVDIRTLDILKYRSSRASLIIITSDKSKLSEIEFSNFISEYGETKLVKSDIFHDRYLIIDKKKCYHLGASLNYLGNKISQLNIVEDDITKLILEEIKTFE